MIMIQCSMTELQIEIKSNYDSWCKSAFFYYLPYTFLCVSSIGMHVEFYKKCVNLTLWFWCDIGYYILYHYIICYALQTHMRLEIRYVPMMYKLLSEVHGGYCSNLKPMHSFLHTSISWKSLHSNRYWGHRFIRQ